MGKAMKECQSMLLLGDYRETLAERHWDACIFDAPFSATTHAGHDKTEGLGGRKAINYKHWTPADVADCVDFIVPRTRQWICSITDDELAPVWKARLRDAGLYVFATIPIVDPGSRCRMQGDGPSCWSTFMVVARPKTKRASAWRTLRGYYERRPGDSRSPHMGGKPFGVMREIVADYSNPGDLVCDITAGQATTLLAALAEGRQAIGSEVEAETFAAACERLGQPTTGIVHEARGQVALF